MFSFGSNSASSNAQPNPAPNSSSLGGFNFNQPPNTQSTIQPVTQPSSFGFGSLGSNSIATPGNTGMFGSFGQSSQNNQPATLSSLSQQTSTGIMYPRDTNFMDLPVDLRKAMEELDKTIQSHADAYRPFSNRVDPTDQLDMIDNKLCLLEEKISAYSTLNAQQTSKISNLKKATSGHWRYSENSARTIEASKHTTDVTSSTGAKVTWTRAFAPNDPTASHFEEILKEMEAQMNEAEEMVEALKKQIEPFISNRTSVSGGQNGLPSPTESVKHLIKTELEISSYLQHRYSQIRDEVELMRRNYRNFCSKYRRDSRDPFAPKIIEKEEREREREKKKDFFGLSHGSSSVTPTSAGLISMLPASTTSLLPSATTGLPIKSSTFGGFSFGRN